jgi:hypothetical protein
VVDKYQHFGGFLKMKVVGFSEMVVPIYQTTWHYSPEDFNFFIHRPSSLRPQCYNYLMY